MDTSSEYDHLLSETNLPFLLSRSGHPLYPELLLGAYISRKDPEKCLRFLLQYLQFRSSDVSSCLDLFSESIVSLVDQRVNEMWKSLGVPPHACLHPLQCVECFKPLGSVSPAGTDDFGVSMCTSCSSEPLRPCSSLNKCLDLASITTNSALFSRFGLSLRNEPVPCISLPVSLEPTPTVSLPPSTLLDEFKQMKGGLYQGIVALAVRRDIKGDLYDVAYNLKTSALGTAIENNFDYGVLRRRSREQKSKRLPSPRKAAVDTSSPTSSLDPPSSPSLTFSPVSFDTSLQPLQLYSGAPPLNPFSSSEAVELLRIARQLISRYKLEINVNISDKQHPEGDAMVRYRLYCQWTLLQLCGYLEGGLSSDLDLTRTIFEGLNQALKSAYDVLNEARNAWLWSESSAESTVPNKWKSLFLGGRASSVPDIVIDASKIEEELECPLCFSIMCEPVTTHTCGHSFCKSCLLRALDNKPECPMCRASLEELLESHEYPINISLSRVLALALPSQSSARAEQVRLEAIENDKNLPIFVCGIVVPTQDSPLHIFEPRYRLLMRRAMLSGSRSFGMTAHTSFGCTPFGVTCRIRGIKMLPDGRSFIDCVGERRFRIEKKAMRDGYLTAKVEFIQDEDREVAKLALCPKKDEDDENEDKMTVNDDSILAASNGIRKYESILRIALESNSPGSAETFFTVHDSLLDTVCSQLSRLWTLLTSFCEALRAISDSPDGNPREEFNALQRGLLRRAVLCLNDEDIQSALAPLNLSSYTSSSEAFEAIDSKLWRLISTHLPDQSTQYAMLSDSCFSSRLALLVAIVIKHSPHISAMAIVRQRIQGIEWAEVTGGSSS
jgi:hypothetical protein